MSLTVHLIPEGSQVVAYAPALELSTYGDSREDAQQAFGEVLEVFLRDTQTKGSLDQVLAELGQTRELLSGSVEFVG